MTMGECVILGSGALPPPVILRSEGDEESLGHALGRERRFFAALRMTMGGAQNDNGGAQNDNGGAQNARGEYVILGTGALPPCHSGGRRFPALSFWGAVLSRPPLSF